MKPTRRRAGLLAVALLSGSSPVWASTVSNERQVQSIDQEVLGIDRALATMTKTTQDSCDVEACRATDFFWGEDGRLRKMVEQKGSSTSAGTTTARFYSDCHLMLVRIAPGNTQAARNPTNIERYYFHKGRLIRVKFGFDDKDFSKEQTDYYQRMLAKDPESCRQPAGGKR